MFLFVCFVFWFFVVCLFVCLPHRLSFFPVNYFLLFRTTKWRYSFLAASICIAEMSEHTLTGLSSLYRRIHMCLYSVFLWFFLPCRSIRQGIVSYSFLSSSSSSYPAEPSAGSCICRVSSFFLSFCHSFWLITPTCLDGF